jgi:hypothetical protein
LSLQHAENKESAQFVEVITADLRSLRLTSDHLLPVSSRCLLQKAGQPDRQFHLIAARDLRVGDCLYTVDMKLSQVLEVNTFLGAGVYTIVLDKADFLVR